MAAQHAGGPSSYAARGSLWRLVPGSRSAQLAGPRRPAAQLACWQRGSRRPMRPASAANRSRGGREGRATGERREG
jgi:hypothetical protein